MKLFIPIFLFGLLQITVFGQVPNQLLKFAESSIDEGNWPVAFEWAKQAYELDTTSFESQAIFAVCAYEIKEFALSSKLFAELNRKDLGKLAPDALFYLASANKQMGNYEDAEIYFRNYLKKSSSSDPYLKSKAKQEIKNCQWAKEYSDRVDSVFVYHLPEKFQNQEADILPRMMENELISYFKEKGVWNKQIIRDSLSVKTMNPEFLAITQYEDLCVGVSYKDNFPVLVELTMAADSSWKIKCELSEINSGESYIGMPYLTKIEELVYLFFVSNREGSIGKKDIWISRFQNGKWQKPFNAGKKVNTLDDEISPFFLEEKLFFSSSWYEGFGGWDIYYAEGSPGSFDLPINAGKPFNTNFNDWGYAVYSDKNIGFFSSDRPLNDSTSLPPCCTDLYGFTWQTKEDSIEVNKQDSLMVVITDLNMSLPIRLFFHNDEPNPRTTDTLSNFTYLETFDKYLDLKGTYITKLSEQEKENSFIEEEVNMFFENEVLRGKMKLMEFESQIESELKKGNQVIVYVRGFASPLAAGDYNRRLSLRRISTIKNQWSKNKLLSGYLKAGDLKLVAIPFGESKADQNVSDDASNQKKSVYSKGARLERKIEIERVEIQRKIADTLCLKWNETLHYLGRVKKGSSHTIEFTLENCGNTTLIIEEVESSCGCTVPEVIQSEILPNKKVAIKATYTVSQQSEGKEIRFVTVHIKGLPPQILTLESIVIH